MRVIERVSIGERLRVRDLRRPFASSESSSSTVGVALRFLTADRVTGPETSESCSDGSGDGEMTRGLAGIAALRRVDRVDMMTLNGGSAGQEMAPVTMRRNEASPQKVL